MPIVEVDGVGEIEFPDDMSQEQIRDVLQKKFGGPQAATQGMMPEQGAGLSRMEEPEPEGVWENVKSAFTGKGRQEYDLPEFDLPFELSGRQAKTALGMMTTFDPKRELNVLRENYPDLKFSEDKFGNVIADAEAYGGGKGYINKPGFSLRDAADMGFQIAAFTPAAKAGGLVGSTLGRAGAVGATSGATQATMDVANQALGGTEDVSMENISGTDVTLASLGGAAFEALGPVVKRLLPAWRRGQKTVTDKMREMFKGAAAEAGKSPDEITDDMIRYYMDVADQSVDPKFAEGLREADEFAIPYTRGQAMAEGPGKIKQLSLEDTLRHSAASPKASQRLRDFETTQSEAIGGARGRIQGQLGRTDELIDRPNQAAAATREGVQARAGALDEAIGEAYEQVGDAYLSGDGIKAMNRRLLDLTKSVEFEKSPTLAPASASVVKQLQSLDEMIKEGARLKPAHIKQLESFRRVLNNKAGAAANPVDKRQVLQVKREFDNYLDDAVDNALLSGDEGALEALKKARGLRAEYGRKFGRRDTRTKSGRNIKDTAGDTMERLISADPTDEQVANYIFGSSKLGGKQGSAQLVKKLKDTLGPDSPEFNQIRQAAFLKLSEPNAAGKVSGQTMLKRLREATEGSGETYMKELFSDKEISLMKRFASAVKRAQPEIENPSKTAYKAASMARQLGDQLMTAFGYAQGGPGGAVAARAGVNAAEGLGGWRQSLKAAKATQGAPRPLQRLNAGSVGAPGSVATFGER